MCRRKRSPVSEEVTHLGCDRPPRPAQVEFYDQITLEVAFGGTPFLSTLLHLEYIPLLLHFASLPHLAMLVSALDNTATSTGLRFISCRKEATPLAFIPALAFGCPSPLSAYPSRLVGFMGHSNQGCTGPEGRVAVSTQIQGEWEPDPLAAILKHANAPAVPPDCECLPSHKHRVT